jgi:hypothetical protein
MRLVVLVGTIALSAPLLAQHVTISDKAALEHDCSLLFANTHFPAKAEALLPVDALPPSIKALHPRRVSVDEEGVHITLDPSTDHPSQVLYLSPQFSESWALSAGFVRIGDRLYTSHDDG